MSEQVRLWSLCEQGDPQMIAFEHARASLMLLEHMVVEQIGTVDDALEDWRDLVPEEVAAIEEAAQRREETDG